MPSLPRDSKIPHTLNDGQKRAEAQRGSPIGHIIAAAAGPRDGDLITLSNLWAKVTIQRSVSGKASIWECSGDCARLAFPDIAAATRYALAELSLYQDGRAD